MNSAGHRVARIGVQYTPGVDLRPAVCSQNCYDYEIVMCA